MTRISGNVRLLPAGESCGYIRSLPKIFELSGSGWNTAVHCRILFSACMLLDEAVPKVQNSEPDHIIVFVRRKFNCYFQKFLTRSAVAVKDRFFLDPAAVFGLPAQVRL